MDAKPSRRYAVVPVAAVAVLLASAVAFSQGLRSASATQSTRNEVGTCQLFKMTNNGKDGLYRINTKTGQVWLYSEYAILTTDDLAVKENAKAGIDKLLEDARKQGKNLYTMPFWNLTSETRSDTFTIH